MAIADDHYYTNVILTTNASVDMSAMAVTEKAAKPNSFLTAFAATL
jgi:hypothetical protein